MSADFHVYLRISCLMLTLPGVTACYSPGKPLPPALGEAMAWTEQAETEFRAGRYSAAQQGYKAALDLHIAANNTPGIIRNLVNLAVVQHTAGQNAAARQTLAALDRHLSLRGKERLDSETHQLLAEASWLKTHILIDEGRLNEARQELDRMSPREGSSRLLNLRARLLLAQKQFAAAESSARGAWSAAKREGDIMEQGDAARYQARALEQLSRHAEAARWYETAVPLDQNASRTHLVADDWLGAARAAQVAGNRDQKHHFARLALDAAKRAGDAARQQQAQNLLRQP
jgi:hypothetical protein|uniref:hypothetical protein n=1 Tax=Prosthecobacter sp. TaxID=1965333 RepID=UPI003783979F